RLPHLFRIFIQVPNSLMGLKLTEGFIILCSKINFSSKCSEASLSKVHIVSPSDAIYEGSKPTSNFAKTKTCTFWFSQLYYFITKPL
ncbi:hypothetical protein MXB_5287, partial [Myxobolus squamalis]